MEASSVHLTGKREGRPPAGTSLGVGQGHGGHTGRAQPTRTHRSTPRRPHRAPEPRLQGFAPQNKLLLRHRKTSAQDERNGENQAVRGPSWDGGPHTDKGPRGPLPTAPRHFTQAAPARPVTSPRPGTPGGGGVRQARGQRRAQRLAGGRLGRRGGGGHAVPWPASRAAELAPLLSSGVQSALVRLATRHLHPQQGLGPGATAQVSTARSYVKLHTDVTGTRGCHTAFPEVRC